MFVRDEATILHADLDAFFASVHQRDDPGSAAARSSSGVAWSSRRATRPRAHGVRGAMGGREARRLCPQAVVVSPNMKAYSEASKAVFEVFDDTTPFVEGMSIDEAFLEVGGLRRVSGTPTEIAVRLRAQVQERVGLAITVGVARTKFLAKVASGVAKPDGLLVVEPEHELRFLHSLPVEFLWGVGPKSSAKLHERGITTVAQVAELPEEALSGMLGPAAGRHLHALAHNRDPRRVQPRRAAIDRLSTCARPPPEVSRRPRRRAGRPRRSRHASTSRRRTGRSDRGPAAPVRRLRARHTIAHPAKSTSHTGTILDALRGLLEAAMPMIDERGITLIGITVANLDDDTAVQLELPFSRASGTRSTTCSTTCASGSDRRRSPVR